VHTFEGNDEWRSRETRRGSLGPYATPKQRRKTPALGARSAASSSNTQDLGGKITSGRCRVIRTGIVGV